MVDAAHHSEAAPETVIASAAPVAPAQQRYSTVAMALHWLIAAMLAFQIGLGSRLEDLTIANGLFDATQLHKSFGISILLLSLLRLVWRWMNPPPAPLPDAAWTHKASKAAHAGLYAFMIGAPLTGWLMVSTSKLDIDTLLFGALPWPDVPFVGGLAAATKEALNASAEWTHWALGWAGIALFALHVIGALRHQWLRGDPLLARMWPGTIGLTRRNGSLLITALLFAAIALAFTARQNAQDAAVADQTAQTEAKMPSAAPGDAAADQDENALAQAAEADVDESAALDTEPGTEETTADAESSAAAQGEPAATAWTWRVTEKNPVRFAFDWNGDTVRGSFSDWQADIRFGPDALGQSRIDVAVALVSARTGEAQVDDALPGADFFAVAANPQARFRSSDIRALGNNRYEARGMLSLRATSKPVTLRFTLDIDGTTARASGSTNINRTAFGVGVGNYGDLAETVRVDFAFTAKRQR